MKNVLALLLAASCCASLFSQNTTTWFVPGCQWRYEFYSQVGPGEEVFEYVGEEMKSGELCTKLHWYGYNDGPLPPGPVDYGFQYFFARNDSVFVWNEAFDEFRLLYDFTRQLGDTVLLNYSLYDKAVIIGTGNTVIQGIPIRYQDIKLIYSLNNPPLETLTRVYERLGGQHLLYWDIESPITEIQYSLDCYRDDEYPQADCALTYDPTYAPFPYGTATWSEETTLWCYFNGFQYKIAGDSVIWGVAQGRKVYARPTYTGSYPCPTPHAEVLNEPFELIGLLGQSIPYKKVNFTRLTNNPSLFPICLDPISNPFPFEETVLLYDFDLEVGDTVAWRSEPNIVLFIDSLQLNDGSWRRTFHFKADSSYFWIEGIGSNLGLFNSRANLNLTDVSCALHCFRENNVLKYNTVSAAFCDSVIVGTNEPPLSEFMRLYPNPTSGQVLLELPDDAVPALLRLFDAQGKLLTMKEITAPQTPLEVSPWSASAVLFLQIQSADGRQAGKILRVER